jgi:uncharacterized membrane protein YeaQ/YmgE (transglycosylase-associated protein family)
MRWAHFGALQFVLDSQCQAHRGAAATETVMDFIIWLIVGGIAGWIAGLIVQGSGFGIIGDIVIGILGGLFAGWLLPMAHVPLGVGVIREIIDAVIGAVILILIVKLVRRAV